MFKTEELKMSKIYITPPFSPLSSSNLPPYYLEVIKDGCIIDKLDLSNKIYHIFGRQGDAVDILLEHQSISRQHAIIHHSAEGSLMIMDMKSAQGTFINKKEIEKEMYKPLNVGDIIKFGQSTRMYVVNGPDEFKPKEIVMHKNSTKISSKQIELIGEQKNDSNWGIRFDDVDNVNNDDDVNNLNVYNNDEDLPDYVKKEKDKSTKYVSKMINDNDINEKDRSIFEKIKLFERKIQNMEEENRRINNKEFENGLSEGQLKVLSRNQEKILEIENEIDILIQQIQDRNDNRKASNSNSKNKKDLDDIDVVDNVVDTTEETADSSTNWRLKKKRGNVNIEIPALKNTTLTYEELCVQQKNLDDKLSITTNELNHFKNEMTLIESKINLSDEVDKIVDTNLLNEYKLKIKASENEIIDLNDKRNYVNKLVQITAPAHLKLRTESNSKIISDSIPSIISQSSSMGKNDDRKDTNIRSTTDQLKSDVRSDKSSSSNDVLNNTEDSSHIPETKKKRLIGPQISLINRGDFINDSNYNSNNYNNNIYNEYDTWVAPKNQTGDGKTSLNDKYGY